ncbi:MAG: DNA-formamidopyrimidine glycosylase family protein, partial [Acidimicrobiia bacterium]|nr:DNA-formamidopyrimidine glycosylase family protein [Acidimicrobiia bacterium]
MPELPDIVVYLEALERRVVGEPIRAFRVASPSVLRTFDPPYDSIVGATISGVRRIGKRIVWDLDDGKAVVIHLMVAGRLKWSDKRGGVIPKKVGLCAWDFDGGTLLLTEQGTKKRAGVWVFASAEAADREDRGGVEPLDVSRAEFETALRAENRTLK